MKIVNSSDRFLNSSVAIELVKSLFGESARDYVIESEYDDVIYWGITFRNADTRIMFGSGRGALEYWVEKGGKHVDPANYEVDLLKEVVASSEENIILAYHTIMLWLSEDAVHPGK